LSDLQRISQDEKTMLMKEKNQLENEIINLQTSLSEKTVLTNNLRAQLDTVSDSLAQTQLENKRLQQQLELIEKHSQWQKMEIENLSKQFNTTRSEQSRQITNLEHERVELKNQLDGQISKVKLLTQQLQNASGEKLNLISQIQELKSLLEQSNIERENESSSHRRFVEHLKASENALEMEKKAALDAVEQCQVLLKNTSKQSEQIIAEKDAKIKQLETDLQRAIAENNNKNTTNTSSSSSISQEQLDKLKVLPSLSPTLLEERLRQNGLTLSDLYAEYAKEIELRRIAETQCKHLQVHLNRIFKEVDEKVPTILKVRADYDRILESHEKTMTRLIEAQEQIQHQQQTITSLQRELETSQQGEEASKRDAADLALQVRHLLLNSNNSSGSTAGLTSPRPFGLTTTSTPPRELPNTTNTTPMSLQQQQQHPDMLNSSFAQDVISENLVTFSNVNELLERNHQLLRVVRRLSAEREKENTKEQETQECWEEIESLRAARTRQEEMIAAIITQRDMYRTLLAQANAEHVSNNNQQQLPLSPQPSSTQQQQQQSTTTPNQQQQQPTTTSNNTITEHMYEQFKEEARRQISDLYKTIDEKSEAIHQVRVEVARAEAERANTNKRLEQQVEMYKLLKNEADMLRNSREEMQKQVQKMQELLQQRQEQVLQLTSEIGHVQVQISQEREKRTSDTIEIALLQERLKTLTEQRDGQRSLAELNEAKLVKVMEEHRHVQTNMERDLASANNKLEDALRISKMDREELVSVNKKRDMERQEAKSAWEKLMFENSNLRNRLVELEVSRESAIKNEAAAVEQVTILKQTMSKLREVQVQHGNINTSLVSSLLTDTSTSSGTNNNSNNSSSISTITTTNNTTSSEIHDLRAELELCRTGLEHMREMAATKIKDAEAYRQISKANEDALKALTEGTEKWKREQEERLQSLNEDRAGLRAELDQARKQIEETKIRAASEMEAYKKKAETLTIQCTELQTSLEEARRNETSTREDLGKAMTSLRDAQANYARELQLHAADTAALTALRNKYDTLESQFATMSKSLDTCKMELLDKETRLNEITRREHESMEKLKSELDDMNKENRILRQQFERLTSSQTSNLSNPTSSSSSGNNVVVESEELKELRNVIQKQRDRIVMEKEMLELDLARVTQQLSAAKKELDSFKQDNAKLKELQILSEEQNSKIVGAVQENAVLRSMNAFITEEQKKLRIELEKAIQARNQESEATMAAMKELETLKSKEKVWEKDLSSARFEISNLRTRLANALERAGNSAKHQEEEEALKRRVEELERERDTINEKLKASLEETERVRVAAQRKSTQLLENQKRIVEQHQQQVNNDKAKLDSLTHDLETVIKERDTLTKEREVALVDKTNLMKEKEESIKQREQELNKIKEDLVHKDEEIVSLTQKLARQSLLVERYRAAQLAMGQQPKQQAVVAPATTTPEHGEELVAVSPPPPSTTTTTAPAQAPPPSTNSNSSNKSSKNTTQPTSSSSSTDVAPQPPPATTVATSPSGPGLNAKFERYASSILTESDQNLLDVPESFLRFIAGSAMDNPSESKGIQRSEVITMVKNIFAGLTQAAAVERIANLHAQYKANLAAKHQAAGGKSGSGVGKVPAATAIGGGTGTITGKVGVVRTAPTGTATTTSSTTPSTDVVKKQRLLENTKKSATKVAGEGTTTTSEGATSTTSAPATSPSPSTTTSTTEAGSSSSAAPPPMSMDEFNKQQRALRFGSQTANTKKRSKEESGTTSSSAATTTTTDDANKGTTAPQTTTTNTSGSTEESEKKRAHLDGGE
jgi:nucleoprotein TPR